MEYWHGLQKSQRTAIPFPRLSVTTIVKGLCRLSEPVPEHCRGTAHGFVCLFLNKMRLEVWHWNKDFIATSSIRWGAGNLKPTGKQQFFFFWPAQFGELSSPTRKGTSRGVKARAQTLDPLGIAKAPILNRTRLWIFLKRQNIPECTSWIWCKQTKHLCAHHAVQEKEIVELCKPSIHRRGGTTVMNFVPVTCFFFSFNLTAKSCNRNQSRTYTYTKHPNPRSPLGVACRCTCRCQPALPPLRPLVPTQGRCVNAFPGGKAAHLPYLHIPTAPCTPYKFKSCKTSNFPLPIFSEIRPLFTE